MSHERLVLGSMLQSKAAVEDATAILAGGDFADPRLGVVFDAIVALDSDGRPVEPLSVSDHMASLNLTGVHLGVLHELVSEVVSTSSAEYHARQVKAASIRRAVRMAGECIANLSEVDDPLDAVNEARKIIDNAVTDEIQGASNEESVYAAIDSLSAPEGLRTPWTSLSTIIRGWSPGMLYVIGARPAVGKTVMGVGALLDAARRGEGSAVMISLEMPKNELYLRMLSAVGSVDQSRLTHRSTRGDDDAKLAKAAGHIARLPLIVDDRSALSLAQIRSLVRGVQRTRPVSVVVVDYLGLVKPPADAPRNDRRVQVDAIAQGLKNLARDLDVPVIALAQLNRGIEGRAEKAPMMSDLRESGGIEAAADCILLMHRTKEDPRDLLVAVEKNRHGPTGLLHLDFQGEYARIEEPKFNSLGATA